MSVSRYTIKARLRLGFAFILALLLVVASSGLVQMHRANTANENIVEVNIKKIELLEEMSDSVHVVSRVLRSIALLTDKERTAQEAVKIAAAREKYDQALRRCVPCRWTRRGSSWCSGSPACRMRCVR